MYIINKFLERVTRLCRFLMSEGYELNHKYQNKNQTVNTNFILKSLKSKNYNPRYIVDIGCGHGEWTKRMLKYYSKANYLLFDADEENKEKLENLIKKNNNINYQITLLSDDYKKYKFEK